MRKDKARINDASVRLVGPQTSSSLVLGLGSSVHTSGSLGEKSLGVGFERASATSRAWTGFGP